MLRGFDKFYSQDRNQTADLLKGFAVLMMIQVHLIELFAKQEIYDGLIGKISLFLGGPPAAPLFMTVMGYFLAKSNKSFLQNLKRGIFLILGGILLNIGLNFHLLILIFIGKIQLNPLAYIFGADILPLAGLSVIMIALIKKFTQNNPLSSILFPPIILIFILILHAETINHRVNSDTLVYIQAFLWGQLEWSYFPFLPWAVYPLAGFSYYKIAEKINIEKSTKDFAFLFSSVVTFVSIEYAVKIASEVKEYYHHNWLYTLWIFQFLIFLICCFEGVETSWGRNIIMLYIKWLGKNVTAAYVIQWIVIGNIATFIYRTMGIAETFLCFLGVIFFTSNFLILLEQKNLNIKSLKVDSRLRVK